MRIAVVGLGYVGLPLAVEFGRQYDTLGFDIDTRRVEQLRNGEDGNRESDGDDIRAAHRLRFTADATQLRGCNVFVVTVPTPVDEHKRPDFTPLIQASRTIGEVLAVGDTVIYESTVYPGATEEICVPELERASGLVFNRDFFVGYSPERINPGDRQRRLVDIPKVTSGSTPEAADFVDALYRSIIRAGTHKAASLRVAEAAKVIENTQRDANIALVNEFALIFQRLGIDTTQVLGDATRGGGDAVLDEGAIQRVMMGGYRQLIPCVMQERGRNPALYDVNLEFVVLGSGKVSAAKVNGQRGTPFASCIEGRLKGIKFPSFDGTKTIASWSMSIR